MKRYWELARAKIDDFSLRERAIIFLAAAFVLIASLNALLLDPLLAKQQALSAQVAQQQEKMKALRGQMQGLVQAKQDDEKSPLRDRLAQLEQLLQEQNDYLQSRSDRLVEPEKMADLLRQVLNKNGGLQLVELKTLPVGLLIEKPPAEKNIDQAATAGDAINSQKQIYKHGVTVSVRGGYADLLRYVGALEKMPTQMFWGEVSLSVERYPDSVLTLTLYTLSLDKLWLTV